MQRFPNETARLSRIRGRIRLPQNRQPLGLLDTEVHAMLRAADVTLRDRSGNVHVRHGKGLKDREVPLNATARASSQARRCFSAAAIPRSRYARSRRGSLASLDAPGLVSAHTLRHTFALAFLRDNPGKLVELANLLGHDSLGTTALYTRSSRDELARNWSLTTADLAEISRCRGDEHRRRYALQLCMLRT